MLLLMSRTICFRSVDTWLKRPREVPTPLKHLVRNLAFKAVCTANKCVFTANSSHTLTTTQEEFKNMGGVIGQSGKLLAKYGRRELTDKVLVFFAFAFFMACVLYIIKKRLF